MKIPPFLQPVNVGEIGQVQNRTVSTEEKTENPAPLSCEYPRADHLGPGHTWDRLPEVRLICGRTLREIRRGSFKNEWLCWSTEMITWLLNSLFGVKSHPMNTQGVSGTSKGSGNFSAPSPTVRVWWNDLAILNGTRGFSCKGHTVGSHRDGFNSAFVRSHKVMNTKCSFYRYRSSSRLRGLKTWPLHWSPEESTPTTVLFSRGYYYFHPEISLPECFCDTYSHS